MVGQTDFASPIRNSYARAQQSLDSSYNNPLGAYTTADVRDKSMREQNSNLMQSEGSALGDAAMQNQQNAFNQQSTVAGLMQPHFYMQKTQNENKFAAGDYVNMALGAASGLA